MNISILRGKYKQIIEVKKNIITFYFLYDNESALKSSYNKKSINKIFIKKMLSDE